MELRIREGDEGAGAGVGPFDGFGWLTAGKIRDRLPLYGQ